MITIVKIEADKVFFRIASEIQEVVVGSEETKLVDVNGDGKADFSLRVINNDGRVVLFTITEKGGTISWKDVGPRYKDEPKVSIERVDETNQKIAETAGVETRLFELEEKYNSDESIYLLFEGRRTLLYFENNEIYIEESFIFDFPNADTRIGKVADNKYIQLDSEYKTYVNHVLSNKGLNYYRFIQNGEIRGKVIISSARDVNDEEYDNIIVKEANEAGFFSCGPGALKETFEKLGKKVGRIEMNEYRGSIGGSILRGFGSIFSDAAVGITMPGEMKEIIEAFGFSYKEIDKLDEADKLLAIRSDIVILVRDRSIFSQHWSTYDGSRSGLSDIIRDVYVIFKKERKRSAI